MKFEVTLALVSNIDDPAKGGAIKVALPDIGGDEYPEWIEPIYPAGCWFCIPEVGDTVLVLRPEGDDITEFSTEVRYLGRLITESEGLPESFKTNYPKMRGFETKAGHQLILDDDTNDLKIKTAIIGHELNLLGDGSITLNSGTTGSKITIETTGNILIQTSTDATIQSNSFISQASVKNHLDSTVTDLNTSPTDYLLKGSTFFLDFVTTFLNAWSLALQNPVPPPTDANWIAYKAAMTTLVNTLITSAGVWVSTTTRTS